MDDRGQSIPAVRSALLFPRTDGAAPYDVIRQAASWLVEHDIEVWVPKEFEVIGELGLPDKVRYATEPEIHDNVDLGIALGGDGTLLRAGRWMDCAVPLMGINLGALGFLSAFGPTQLVEALQQAVDGALQWEARLRVRVEVRRAGKPLASETACNDAYIKHGELPRMLQLQTTVADRAMAQFRADGLIVSTPMGSTAYNLSAGGPIVEPATDVLTITPICPHSLTHRPVVSSAAAPIGITFTGPEDASPATLSVDGQWNFNLEVGDEVRIERHPQPLRLVPPQATVFEVLATKLGWAGPH